MRALDKLEPEERNGRRLALQKYSIEEASAYSISSCLELDDLVLSEAEVHPLRVLQVEGALVKLGHRVIRPQESRLLVHLPDD